MIYLEFNDFGQLYHDLTRFPIKHEKEFGNFGNDYFEVGQSQYINNLIISTPSHKLEGPSSDLGNFNYTLAKWTTLLNKYVDKDDYLLLKRRLIESQTKTLTFNFKVHIGLSTDTDQTKNRDSCIIALVFSRNGGSGKWTTVNIFYRVAEIYKKFAVDLMLLNRMFEDLPNLDLKEHLFHIPQPFYSVFILCELIDSPLFKVEEFKDSDSFVARRLYANYLKYYGPDAKLSNYHAIRRKQDMKLNGIVRESIPLESLKMFSDIETPPVVLPTPTKVDSIIEEQLW